MFATFVCPAALAPAVRERGTRATKTWSDDSSPTNDRNESVVEELLLDVVELDVPEDGVVELEGLEEVELDDDELDDEELGEVELDEDELDEELDERKRPGSAMPTQGARSLEIRAVSERATVASSITLRPCSAKRNWESMAR